MTKDDDLGTKLITTCSPAPFRAGFYAPQTQDPVWLRSQSAWPLQELLLRACRALPALYPAATTCPSPVHYTARPVLLLLLAPCAQGSCDSSNGALQGPQL